MAEDLSNHGQVLICNTESSSVTEKSILFYAENCNQFQGLLRIKNEFFGAYNTPEESN